MTARWALALVLASSVSAHGVSAQLESRFQVGARMDVLASRITAAQGGVEVSTSVGRNVRLALVTAAGDSWDDGRSGLSARGDLVGRFLLDPEFTERWAPYVGAGLGLRYDHIADWRGTLIALVGVEGPNWKGVVPFAEAGVGGGVRLGLGFRATRRAGR